MEKINKRTYNFPEGEILLVDKPYRWTSFDVVNKIKKILKHELGLKDIKIGHAGTLDPLATGLLIICTGKFTKRIEEIQSEEKEYIAKFHIGKTTPCFDLEKEVDAVYPTEHITKAMIMDTAMSFVGEQEQIPPLFSAIQIDGKRAYELARKGKETELKARKIFIREFEILSAELPEVEARIVCSKGTYIRAIARDFGIRLNSGAYLAALRRTRSGCYHVNDALTPDELIKTILQQKNKEETSIL